MDIFGDLPDLTRPLAGAPSAHVSGGVLDSSSVFEVGDVSTGKKTDQMSELGSVISNLDQASSTSPSSSRLFFLEEPLGVQFCGSTIGSKQSVRRFCISSVVVGTNCCSVAAHSKNPKAEAPTQAWYITAALRGKGGGRAALADKFVTESAVTIEFKSRLDDESMEPSEWDKLFTRAKMAKQGIRFEGNMDEESSVNMSAYYTPLKRRPGISSDDSGSSWVGIQDPSPRPRLPKLDLASSASPASGAGKEASTRRQFQVIQGNFDRLEDGLDEFQASIGEGMVELQSRLNGLALQVSSTDGRLGRPSGFGAEFGVTNAFDGIRYLCEKVETVQDYFKRVPYETTVSRVNVMETTLQAFESQPSASSLVSDLNQKVQDVRAGTRNDLELLRTKFVEPISRFYGKCVGTPESSIFNRLDVLEKGLNSVSNSGNVFGSLKYMGGYADGAGPQAGGPAHVSEMTQRLAELEAKNADLLSRLGELESRGQALSTGPVGPSQSVDLVPIMKRLGIVEGAQGGVDSVNIAGWQFGGPGDCESFLLAEVPESVRVAFGYDMVSLLHRASVDPQSTAEILSRDYNAKKGGFPNLGSAFIYTSLQQALPEPFSATTTGKNPLPLPAIRTFESWDELDGSGGLRNRLLESNKTTVESLQGVLNRELQSFPRAAAVFGRMITNSEDHFRKLALFLTETRNICHHQHGDAAESWEYPCKVVRGVFDECRRVRSVGAERSSVDEFTLKDAGRMLWAALRCHKLMDELVTSNFQGHPALARYSIQYLFKHRLTPKDVEGLTTTVGSLKTELKGMQATQQKLKTKVGLH
jgi:hypothetical protein